MPLSDFVFLTEDASHDAVIATINEEAFGPGRFVRAAERVREQGPHERALSFVCTDAGAVVGSVRMTPVMAGPVAGHLLGPLAVRPSHMKIGIGRELVRVALKAAREAGSDAVILVGDAPYYGPLGFSPVPGGKLVFPGPVDARRVLAAMLDGREIDRLAGPLHHRARS